MKVKELEKRLRFADKQFLQRKRKPQKKHGNETYKVQSGAIVSNRYCCSSGKHFYNAEEKADNCKLCRRTVDAKVRRFFKRQSDAMLQGEEQDQSQNQKRRRK